MKKIPAQLKAYAEELRSTEKPSVEIAFSQVDTLPWESKCGGCPYLESEEDYPLDEEGNPMIFLAQINLDEMPHLEDFPEQGLLQFYIGYDGEDCKVIYIPDYKTDESALLSVNPFEEDYEEMAPYEAEVKMEFRQESRFVCTNCAEFDSKFGEGKVAEEDRRALRKLCYGAGSRVGGYPLFVQEAPVFYDEGECDTLLLQLDGDDECGIMFGDSGNCFFLISKEDLKNRDFDRVEFGVQGC